MPKFCTFSKKNVFGIGFQWFLSLRSFSKHTKNVYPLNYNGIFGCCFQWFLWPTHPHQLPTHPPTPRLIPYTFTLLHPPSHPHIATGAQANYAGTDMCGTLQNTIGLQQTFFAPVPCATHARLEEFRRLPLWFLGLVQRKCSEDKKTSPNKPCERSQKWTRLNTEYMVCLIPNNLCAARARKHRGIHAIAIGIHWNP